MITLTLIWFAAGAVGVVFYGRVDAYALRFAKSAARVIGEWTGTDVFGCARFCSRAAVPVSIVYCAAMHIWIWDASDSVWLSLSLLFWLLMFTGYVAFGLPREVDRVERERAAEMIRGSLSPALWRSLRSDRAINLVFVMFWLCPHANLLTDVWAFSTTISAFLYWLARYAAFLLLSIEQPPFQYVSLRDRVRMMFAVPSSSTV